MRPTGVVHKVSQFPEQIWRSRPKRIAFLLVTLFALATQIAPEPLPPPDRSEEAALTIEAVALDPDDPARRRVGGLLFEAGWVLTSDSRHFGGLSALHVESGQVTAISDGGVVARFAVPTAAGHARVRLDPLPLGPGPATRKSNRDTEAMAIFGDQLWAGYEKHNMVWRYRRSDLRALAAARPALMQRWRSNSGTEGMVRLADGRFLVLEEGRNDDNPFSRVVLFDGDPTATDTNAVALRYRRLPGYRITDAAQLPDGRLLLLNRRFTLHDWISARLTIAGIEGLGEGATIESRDLATLEAPLTVDNMEGLSVSQEGGRTIVWIASDDNFSPLQRTLLLKFVLAE
jgi:hypothetical protein